MNRAAILREVRNGSVGEAVGIRISPSSLPRQETLLGLRIDQGSGRPRLGSAEVRRRIGTVMLPGMQRCTDVGVEKVKHRGRGEGRAAVRVGDPAREPDPGGYHGVSTERRRRDDRERDAGASEALADSDAFRPLIPTEVVH